MLVSETKQYASEAGHWYTKSGEPCHQLPYKDKKRKGELRNTTLRDARELGLYPSVSAILGVVEKKGLDGWKKEQVARAAWDFMDVPRFDSEQSEDHWVSNLLERAEARMTKARDLGTEIHGAIERYLRELNSDRLDTHFWRREYGESPHVKAAVAALKDLGVWEQPFRAERSFASPQYGFGGCVDFSTEEIVVDYKAVTRLEKKLTYWDRAAQLASYSMGIHGKIVRCANIFIDNTTVEYHVHEWSKEDLEHGWSVFLACLNLWCLINKYDPRSLSVTSS